MSTTNDVYVISLDAMDLNWLPISQKHRDGGTVPLWSKSNLDSKRNEYYEFVIKTDDTKEDKNEPVIENVTCHICDINVPKGYFNEHKNGFRHKFNRKVADTALKRLHLYVKNENVNEYNEKLPSKHFCPECSILIDSEDEKSHKQTTGHRNSLFLERFLNDFLNFYTNNDNEIRKDVKMEVTNITETVLENIKKESVKTEDVKETKGTENYMTVLNSDKVNNNLRSSPDLQDEEPFLEVFDGSNINKFKVTERCYDAIVATDAKPEYCMICNEMFERENRLLHVDSALHGQNLRQKPLDKNCVRKINSTHHHCALCNDYFTEYDFHVNSKEHLTNFRNKMIIQECDKTAQNNDNSNKDKKDDNSRKYSDVLKSDENRSSIDANKNTGPVNKETRNSVVPSTSSSVAKNQTVENSNETVKLDPNSSSSQSQVKVPNTLNNTTDSNALWSYVIKENERIEARLAAAAKVREINENIISSMNKPKKQFCDTCNKWISMKRFQRHINRKKHILKAIPDHRYLFIFLDKENALCIICQTTISKVLLDITNHFTSSGHINKYDKLLKAQSITKIDDEKYYCSQCKVYILHKNEILHIESKEHTEKVGFSETGEIDEQCDNITGSVDGDATETVAPVGSNTAGVGSGNATDNVQVNAYNDMALETVSQPDCNSVNVNSINSLSEKLESIFHKYLSKIESNNDGQIDSDDNDSEIDETPKNSKKKPRRDLKSYFCDTCEVQVPNNPNSITDHNGSAKHMRKLKMYHVVDGTLVKKITNLHYQMKKTAILNVVTCIVCHIDLKYSDRNIWTHIEGESHKSNYKEFCARNFLVLRLCILFCTACGVKAGPGDEFIHCNGIKHKKNLELVTLNGHQ